jgi:hypothetical protein
MADHCRKYLTATNVTTCNTLITSFWYLLWWNNSWHCMLLLIACSFVDKQQCRIPPPSNCNFPEYFKKGNQCLLYSQNPALNHLNENAVHIVSLCWCSVHFNMIQSMPNSMWSFLMFCNRNCVWLHYLYMHAVYPPSRLSSLNKLCLILLIIY